MLYDGNNISTTRGDTSQLGRIRLLASCRGPVLATLLVITFSHLSLSQQASRLLDAGLFNGNRLGRTVPTWVDAQYIPPQYIPHCFRILYHSAKEKQQGRFEEFVKHCDHRCIELEQHGLESVLALVPTQGLLLEVEEIPTQSLTS